MREKQHGEKPRSRRMYVLWAIALALLLSIGGFCWLVVVPVWQIRGAVARCKPDTVDWEDRALVEIENLGGSERAVERLSMYLRCPEFAAPDQVGAVVMMAWCDEGATPALIGLLEDERVEIREAAAVSLGRHRKPQARHALVRALGDADWRVRFSAVVSLSRFEDPESIQALRRSLKDANWTVRHQALESLMLIGGEGAFRAIVVGTVDEDPALRARAVDYAAYLGKSEAIELLKKAKKDTNVEVREKATRALNRLEPLIALLKTVPNPDHPWSAEEHARASKKLAAAAPLFVEYLVPYFSKEFRRLTLSGGLGRAGSKKLPLRERITLCRIYYDGISTCLLAYAKGCYSDFDYGREIAELNLCAVRLCIAISDLARQFVHIEKGRPLAVYEARRPAARQGFVQLLGGMLASISTELGAQLSGRRYLVEGLNKEVPGACRHLLPENITAIILQLEKTLAIEKHDDVRRALRKLKATLERERKPK
jgi:HEAT repeats